VEVAGTTADVEGAAEDLAAPAETDDEGEGEAASTYDYETGDIEDDAGLADEDDAFATPDTLSPFRDADKRDQDPKA